MSKKPRKKRKSPPPLSGLDKLIYGVLISLAAGIIILLIVAAFKLQHAVAFSVEDTAAYSSSLSVLFLLPFFIYLTISLFVGINLSLGGKKPIFGNKKIRYGQYPWPEELYPLFDERRKTRYKRPSSTRFARAMLRLWLIGLLLCLALTPFGIFGRDALHKDGSISVHNAFNIESNDYVPQEYDSLSLKIYYHHIRHSGYWSYSVTIKTVDGPAFQFNPGDFSDTGLCLDTLLMLKNMFPADRVSIEGRENWDKLMEDLSYSEEETAKLRKIFFN